MVRTFGDWFIAIDNKKLVVRRLEYVDGVKVGAPRMPIDQYRRAASQGRSELEKFVARRNGRDLQAEAALQVDAYRRAHIDQNLIDLYLKDRLSLRVTSPKDQGTAMRYLRSYGLDFFVLRLEQPDVLEWHRQRDLWKRYLLNSPTDKNLKDNLRILPHGKLLAKKVILQIVHELNEFLAFMHDQRPEEVPPISIRPFRIKDALLKHHEATRLMLEEERATKYIPPNHMKRILDALERDDLGENDENVRLFPWADFARIAYAYGLRRNEVLGLTTDAIYEDHLSVERQLITYHPEEAGRLYGPVKSRAARKVPHWNISPDELYDMVERIQEWMIHPDTITRKFVEVTKEIFEGEVEDGYIPHDLRRSWITDMLRSNEAEDVRLAAGHGNLATTYKHYVKDTRTLTKKRFVPKSRKAG